MTNVNMWRENMEDVEVNAAKWKETKVDLYGNPIIRCELLQYFGTGICLFVQGIT